MPGVGVPLELAAKRLPDRPKTGMVLAPVSIAARPLNRRAAVQNSVSHVLIIHTFGVQNRELEERILVHVILTVVALASTNVSSCFWVRRYSQPRGYLILAHLAHRSDRGEHGLWQEFV